MKKKSVSLVAALILMLAAIPVATTGVASAHVPPWVINSSWATIIPTINGVHATGEWTVDATKVLFGPATCYVKNDGTNLYLAAKVPDPNNNLSFFPWVIGDFMGVFFDNGPPGVGHDGVLTQGDEDGMAIVPGMAGPPSALDYEDFWWDPAGSLAPWPFPPVSMDGFRDGSGDWTYVGGNYYFEASKPLNSLDAQDLTALPGDTVGLTVVYYQATGAVLIPWPTWGGYNPTDPTTWGDLVLASGPSPTPTTPAPTSPPPSGGGGGGGFCFIATAAYGSYLDSHVETLRDFRDQYLVTNPVGSALVSAYYELSPPVAEFIDDHPALKPMVRAGLMPAVALSTVAVNTTLAEKIAMVSGLALVSLALGIWLRRRAARKMTY